jgi:hypothetical protein
VNGSDAAASQHGRHSRRADGHVEGHDVALLDPAGPEEIGYLIDHVGKLSGKSKSLNELQLLVVMYLVIFAIVFVGMLRPEMCFKLCYSLSIKQVFHPKTDRS